MHTATTAHAESEVRVVTNTAGMLSDVVIDHFGLHVRGTIVFDLGDIITWCPEVARA